MGDGLVCVLLLLFGLCVWEGWFFVVAFVAATIVAAAAAAVAAAAAAIDICEGFLFVFCISFFHVVFFLEG